MTREDQENRVCLQEGTSTSQALFLGERVDGDSLVLTLSGMGCPLSLLRVKATAPGGRYPVGVPSGSPGSPAHPTFVHRTCTEDAEAHNPLKGTPQPRR